jgi:predicted nicotinamide N-methyase
MPGYATKLERIAIAGADDLMIRSLLNRQQFSDPLGEAARLGISAATWPIFGVLWASGMHLATRMAARTLVADERVLEVGCGLALASLVAHRRGVNVTASDCHPLAARFLADNLLLNQLSPMKYRHGHWAVPTLSPAHEDAIAHCRVKGRFDLIIGSDLLYERDERGSFAEFIGDHASATSEVWIIDPDRGNRAAFNRHMVKQGYALTEQRLDAAATLDREAYKGRSLTYRRAG